MRLLSALNFAYNQARRMVLEHIGNKNHPDFYAAGQVGYGQDDDRIAAYFASESAYLLDERNVGTFDDYEIAGLSNKLPTFGAVEQLVSRRLTGARFGIGQKFVVSYATGQPFLDFSGSTTPIVDGFAISNGDLFLLYGQPDNRNNGIWRYTPFLATPFTKFLTGEVSANHLVLVQKGNLYRDAVFICTTDSVGLLGSTLLDLNNPSTVLEYTRFGVSQPVGRSFKQTINLTAGTPFVVSHNLFLADPEDYIIQLKQGSNVVYAEVETLSSSSLRITADSDYTNVRVLIKEVL